MRTHETENSSSAAAHWLSHGPFKSTVTQEYPDMLRLVEVAISAKPDGVSPHLPLLADTARQIQFISRLFDGINSKESLTLPHSLRSFGVAVAMGLELGLNSADLQSLRIGALLHDIGKFWIPNSILLKSDPLTEPERKVIRAHPIKGAQLLSIFDIDPAAIRIVRHHHERFDGSGYPDGLSGKNIPLLARLFAIADSLDAMVSTRPYKAPLIPELAASEIASLSGKDFDPELTSLFATRSVNEWLERGRIYSRLQ